MQKLPTPRVPVAWGELIDKITILELKRERLQKAPAFDNVTRELSLLNAIAIPALEIAEIQELKSRLELLNAALWDIEDQIRVKEASCEFDPAFIELARSIYKKNDARGVLKRRISVALGSELIEEKGYRPY